MFSYSLYSQETNLVWQNYFGGNENELCPDIEQMVDGGFLGLGYTKSFGNGDWDLLLVKTDYYGEVEWYKTFGGIEDDCGNCINKTSDGGFIISGYNGSVYPLSHSWIIKTDAYGDTMWTKIYDFYQHSSASSVIQTNDGGYVLTGSANQYGTGTNVNIIKTDTYGDTSWTNIYNFSNVFNSYGFSIKETIDNGYVVTGRTEGTSGEDIFLLKTNALGDSLWSYIYNIYDHDHSSEVIQTYDEGYVITGYALSLATGFSKMINIKTDNLGNIMWTSISELFGGSSGSDIIQTADSNFIILGTSGGKLLTTGLSQNGDSMWTNLIGDSSNRVGSSIKKIDNGEYIFSGSIRDLNTNNIDILYGRLSSNPLIANFFTDTLSGILPLEVSFQDSSSNNVSKWSWDFNNDGLIDSDLQNPIWNFTEPDTYSVKLIAYNESFADTLTRMNYITTNFDSFPNLYNINDVPIDQGGWVTVNFTRSMYDTDTLIHPESKTEIYTVEAHYDSMWTALNSTVAYGKSYYSVLVPTIIDSTAYSNGLIDFRIIAGMDEGNFVSNILSGYSVDNLAPNAPQNFSGFIIQDTLASLQWSSNQEDDLQFYSVYRSIDGINFEFIIESIDTTLIDTIDIVADSVMYAIKAVDYSGNYSNYSNFVNFATTYIKNNKEYNLDFRLYQNYPNPFNPITKINFNIPQPDNVRIEIFNVLGQKIKTLLNKQMPRGIHEIEFNGQNFPSGVYIYRIKASKIQYIKKMILLR